MKVKSADEFNNLLEKSQNKSVTILGNAQMFVFDDNGELTEYEIDKEIINDIVSSGLYNVIYENMHMIISRK